MKRWIELLMDKKVFAFLIIFFIVAAGIVSYQQLKIDVFPDPSPVLVQIFTECDGMAPEEVEKFVSYAVETSLYGLPDVEKITSHSTFGLSTVNVYFDDAVDIHFARQLVSQQLPAIGEQLPDFVEAPKLGPITTGLGMVYIYALEGDLPSMELRTLQDWVIKFQLQTIPGVAAVMSHGGDIKQYQVIIDADQLVKYDTPLNHIVEHIKKSSRNVTAGYIVKNKEEYIIRGVGLLEDIEALKRVLVKESGSTPIFLGTIAQIKVGAAIKRGEALLDDRGQTVSGILMKLIGVNTAELIEKIDARIEEINAGLPEGVRLVPVYNQALIIKAAFRTVSEALIIGILLVSIILFLFLNDWATSLVSTLSIPFAVFAVFILMNLLGMTADLMSFGGLAIGIGLLVDASVVVVENIARNRETSPGDRSDRDIILFSVQQVLRPLSFAMLIIILSFLPLLTLQGTEGKMFKPFGVTLLIAIVSAIVYALFFSPLLMHTVRSRKRPSPGKVFEYLKAGYLRIFDFFYPRQRLTIGLFLLIFIISLVALNFSGSEFIPTLNEQTLQLMVLLPNNTDIDETVSVMQTIHQEIGGMPEIKTIYSRVGRGEAGTHPHPVNMGNTILVLNERKKWRVASEEELIHVIQDRVKERLPGVLLNFTQPIKHNLDELLTGVRADLAVKIFGDDYRQLVRLAEEASAVMQQIPGVADTQVSRVSGQNEISVRLNREKLARYHLDPSDVLEEIEAAVGGKTIAKVYEGDVAFDVFLRYSESFRNNLGQLRQFRIRTDEGYMIPLSTVADINEEQGFSTIIRENGKRYITVQCNVRGRDIGSIVKESQKKIFEKLELPFGYFVTWGGQFELKERAEKRMVLVLLVTFFLILVLLFDYLKSWKDIAVILVNLPVSLSGGVISLWLFGAYLSVPSTIGFLALLGIALENTLILISFLKRKTAGSDDFDAAVRESVAMRLRPVLMTKFTTIIGLIPLLFSVGIGAEIQRPLVIVVIGGIFFSIFTTLLLMPVVFRKLNYRPQS